MHSSFEFTVGDQLELIGTLGIPLLVLISIVVWRLITIRKRRHRVRRRVFRPSVAATARSESGQGISEGHAQPEIGGTDNDQLEYYSGAAQLKVEELSDVIQEADFWIALNDPSRAIEVLETYGLGATPDSPAPWLYLLSLYRDVGRGDDYLTLQRRIKEIFNVLIPEWGHHPPQEIVLSLADYPVAAKKIIDFWGTAMIAQYLDNLLLDNRRGQREGFPLSVYKEILKLSSTARGVSDAEGEEPAWLKRLNA